MSFLSYLISLSYNAFDLGRSHHAGFGWITVCRSYHAQHRPTVGDCQSDMIQGGTFPCGARLLPLPFLLCYYDVCHFKSFPRQLSHLEGSVYRWLSYSRHTYEAQRDRHFNSTEVRFSLTSWTLQKRKSAISILHKYDSV